MGPAAGPPRQSRRLAVASLALLTGLGCAGSEASRATKSAALPNVILLTVDTLRSDHLSCYGSVDPRTPAMDALARQGILFERAVSPVPLTLPSHASLMTGTLPVSHGVRDNTGFALPESAHTLAESLSARGYRTGAFVGAYVLDGRFGLNQGFDLYRDDFQPDVVGGPTMEILERPAADVLGAAENWIRSAKGTPLFAWIHLFDPHSPYAPPVGFEQSYSGEIAYVDDQLSRFWEFLKAAGIFDSSLIVLTSDHGEGLGEHGEATHGMFLYDSTLLVPLIFKLPLGGPAARVSQPVRLIDVMPTVLDLLGAPVPDSVQGVSLKAAWSGAGLPELPAVSETLLPLLNYGWSDISSYRTGKRKFIDAPVPELYDLANDPKEAANLLPGQQAVAAALKAEKKSLLDRFSRSSSGEAWRTPDAETVERLRSLGYASLARPAGSPAEGDPIRSLKESLGSDLPDPKSKIEIFNLVWEAQAASRAGSYAESNNILDRILRRDPNMFMAYSIQALNLLSLNEPTKAARSLRTAVKLRPDDPGAQLYLSLAELRLGNLDAAAKGFERTLSLDPESDAARNNLATVYARQKRFPQAEALLSELAARNPDDAAAFLNLGVVHMMQSHREAAIGAFRQALLRRPNLPEAHNNLGLVLLQSGEPEAAVAEFNQAIAQRPGYSNAHLNLAKAYRMMGRNREAEEQLRLAQERGNRR